MFYFETDLIHLTVHALSQFLHGRVFFKVGFYLKAVFPSCNLGLMRISRSRFKQ